MIAVEVMCVWYPEDLAAAWCGRELPAPEKDHVPHAAADACTKPLAKMKTSEIVSALPIQLQPDMVGPLARESAHRVRPGQVIQDKYRIINHLGSGSYTEAYVAEDVIQQGKVCLKQHHIFDVEVLADLVVLDQRLQQVDPGNACFPRLHEAFFDGLGWTVESLFDGQDLQVKRDIDPCFFMEVPRLRLVSRGVLKGLALLEEAGIVHNDLKPDNILWVEGTSRTPIVRIVDFNCARLDQRELPEQNWNLREGGVGCRAYCSPEMGLGLPVTHSSDIWSLAVVLCELYSGCPSSLALCTDKEAVQVSVAQALGLSSMPEGIPSSFLRKSPLDLRRNFTPAFTAARGHLPLRQNHDGELETLRPTQFGLAHMFGEKQRQDVLGFREFLEAALVFDGTIRPSAKQLLMRCDFVTNGAAAKALSVKRAAKPP